MQHLSRQLTKGIVMKTVGEFKKAGLVFVEGDCVLSITDDHESEDADLFIECVIPEQRGANWLSIGENAYAHKNWILKQFAWRENTGVKPEFNGLIDFTHKDGDEYFSQKVGSKFCDAWEFLGGGNEIAKWRPSLNQPPIAEPDTKESAIHKAWVALGGSIRHDFQDAHSIWPVSGASYVNGEYYFSSGDTCFESDAKLVCTVKEFTDYCEKMSAEEKRMDIIGQNGNDGLHYDNTAQQVEALFVDGMPNNMKFVPITGVKTKQLNPDNKPIFTQAMADNGDLPPVGSEFLGNMDIQYITVGYTTLGSVVGEVLKSGSIHTYKQHQCKPIDSRTDREKMHEQIHSIMTDDSGRFMKFSELPDYAIESYDKLIDTFGLLKC
jgi:hypothetical protein